MGDLAGVLIVLGGLFLLGLAAEAVGRWTAVPRVTLLLLFGFAIGPSGMDLLSALGEAWFQPVAHVALIMVGFLLGEKLTLSSLREHGRVVLSISIAEVVATAVIVLLGLLLLGVPAEIALLLGGIAPATAPAASADVVHELGAEGTFSRTLLGIVALDDAWGLVVFSLLMAAVHVILGHDGASGALASGAWEIGGALLVGIAVGVPASFLTGRFIEPGQPTLAEALGVVFLCGGIALWLGVSFLIASMVMGAVVANLARHHTRPFHAIEGIEWPLLILFFVFAGASLRLEVLSTIGLVAVGYVVLRILGRYAGAWIGGRAGGADPVVRRWMGTALMPQAGVAVGMALVASQSFPRLGETILSVVIASTVFFELLGPPLTRLALLRAGEGDPHRPRAGP
jgi:Kef-type K+ transport system membrane component KefB